MSTTTSYSNYAVDEVGGSATSYEEVIINLETIQRELCMLLNGTAGQREENTWQYLQDVDDTASWQGRVSMSQ